MNRYSNLSTSQFNPLSMQEIFTVPLAKQRKHDESQAALDQLGLFDINRLEKDESLATDYINNYTNKIDEEINKINQSGITNQSIGRVKSLARERDKWLKQGQGKKIQDNYNAYISNKEQLDKLYEKGDISANKYQLGLQQALESYKGVAENDSYNSFNAVADTDYVKKALDLAKSVPLQERESFLVKNGYQLTPDGSMYIHGETGREFTEQGAIAELVIHGLGNDSNVMSDLKQREQLGLFGNRSVTDVLTDLSQTLERNLSVNNKTLNTKLTGNKGFTAGQTNNEDSNLIYNERGFTKVEVFDDNTLEKLSKIGEKVEQTTTSAGTGAPGITSAAYVRTIKNSNLKPEEISKLEKITNNLFSSQTFRNKLNLTNNNINDPETLKKIVEYTKKFQDNAFTVNVIKPNSNDGRFNSSPITDSKMQNASDKFVNQEVMVGGIKLYDKESGEILDNDDLNDYVKFEYSGYYPADNLITNLKGANEATMVSPREIIAYDEEGKRKVFYGSRVSSEMDKPAFKAAKMIKDIKVSMTQNLGAPTSINVPLELQNVIQDFTYEYDIDTNQYNITFKGVNNGSVKQYTFDNLTPSALNSYINGLFGIE